MANVVLVIDMVRGFLEPGHNLYCEGYRSLIPNIRGLLERETAAGSNVLFISDHHDPDDLEFQIFRSTASRAPKSPKLYPNWLVTLPATTWYPRTGTAAFSTPTWSNA